MFAPFKISVGARAVALAVALATSSFSAQAVLERVGPVNSAPSVGGYPSWYQDTTGVALEFCDPTNAAELSGGWCLLLPPMRFPKCLNELFGEHLLCRAWGATTAWSGPVHGKAFLSLDRGAFANGGIPGDRSHSPASGCRNPARLRHTASSIPTAKT
jgi:hypothetical protein